MEKHAGDRTGHAAWIEGGFLNRKEEKKEKLFWWFLKKVHLDPLNPRILALYPIPALVHLQGFLSGQGKGKGGAFARFTFPPEPPFVKLNNMFGNAEAESGPGWTTGF